ncbi:MAG: hypothetical protein OEM05_07290 [Myxococcales bacterium]|nr:hypothetical protein [Myxococcales bacterium]
MLDDPFADLADRELLAPLSPEERKHLELHHYVKSGEHVIWIEPEGRVRQEKYAKLYYLRTAKGVFRTSRVTDEIVEV